MFVQGFGALYAFFIHKISSITASRSSSKNIPRAMGPSLDSLVLPDRSSSELITRYEGHCQFRIITIDVQDQNHQSLRYSHVAASRCQVAPAEARMQGPPHQASCVKFVHFIVKSFPCFVESCTYLRPGGLHQLAVNNRREIPGQAHVVPSHSNLRIRRTEDEPIEVIKFRSLE